GSTPPARRCGGSSPPRLFDDDLPLHERVDLAVVGEGAALAELDEDALARLDPFSVEDPALGRRVFGVAGVDEGDAGAALHLHRRRLEGEADDRDALAAAGGGGAGGAAAAGQEPEEREAEAEREDRSSVAKQRGRHDLRYGWGKARVQTRA